MDFDALFFPEGNNNDQRLRDAIEEFEGIGDTLEMEHHRLVRRHQRLELLVEALLWYLEEKDGLDRDLLRVMMQRLDLADGVEDGRIGPDRTEAAPKCANCAYPFNDKRTACLYCGAPKPKKSTRNQRMTNCSACRTEIKEAGAFITMRGLLCATCFANREAGVTNGRLSITQSNSGALSEIRGPTGALSEPDD